MEDSSIPTERRVGFPRLLRCMKTSRYYTEGGWTHDPMQAQLFPDDVSAIRRSVDRDLHYVELVIRSDDTEIFSAPNPVSRLPHPSRPRPPLPVPAPL